MSPEVVTEVGAEMPSKMVAAGVIRATSESAGVRATIKAYILPPDPRHEVGPDFVLYGSDTVNSVEVIKNGSIRNYPQKGATIGHSVRRLPKPGRHLSAETDVVLQNDIAAETHVKPATFRRESVRAGGSGNRPKAQGSVKLLGMKTDRGSKH